MFHLARFADLAVRGLSTIMLTLLLAGAAGLAILHARGEQMLSVKTASMVPSFRPGDALIVAPVKADRLTIGQVISYRSPHDPRVIISHRLMSRTSAGQLIALAPGLGKLLDFLHRPLGLAVAVYLPALGLILVELRRLVKQYQTVQYRISGYKAYN